MHIAVLLAGVADPKKPLPAPASGDWRDLRGDPAVSYKLSPFDEAALEIALKLRDRHAGTRITALVTDGAADVALMRAVAALRPDRALAMPTPAAQRGNPAWLARHAAVALWSDAPKPDLILVGREHGDMDDGITPPYLAQAWGLPYAGLALQVHANASMPEQEQRPMQAQEQIQAQGQPQAQADDAGDVWTFTRSAGSHDESLCLPAPALASVSNDKSNRLRHPLMKNVLLAKQQRFDPLPIDADVPAAHAVLVQASPVRPVARGADACRMLQGSAAEQARALAAYLKPFRSPSHADR